MELEESYEEKKIPRDFLFNRVQPDGSDRKFDNDVISDEQNLSNHDGFDL